MAITVEQPRQRVVVPRITPDYSTYLVSRRKRALDVAVSLLARPATGLAQIWAINYLSKVLDEGDPLYRQFRAGVEIIKLRTMVNTPETQTSYSRNNDRIPNAKVRRIRDLRIDEFPQVKQVTQGVMSVVGFRPVHLHYEADFREHLTPTDFRDWKSSHLPPNKPALIGLGHMATIHLEDATAEFCQAFAYGDMKYRREATLRTDARLIAQTAISLGGEALAA